MKTFLKNLIAPIVVALLVSGIAHTGFQQWSVTPATNATADPTINWSPGMSPSSVSVSARAMMARLAEFRKDFGGINVTSGTATAYSLTTNQGDFTDDAAGDGFVVGFIPNVTNTGGATTINVDAAGAQPLRQFTGANLNAGVLVAGSVYRAVWRNSTSEWLLFGSYTSQFEVPIGTMLPYTDTTAPNSNYVIPTGQCLSQTTYATYFAMVGNDFGTGCAAGEFKVIDMRGRVPAGTDALDGVAIGRLNTTSGMSGITIGSTGGTQTHTLTSSQMPSHTHTLTDPGHNHDFSVSSGTADEVTPTGARAIASGNNIYRTATPNTQLRDETIGDATTGITIANTGGGNAHPIVQPTVMVFWILRVR